MLMTDQQPAELSQPRIGPLHNPAALVAPQFASIFVTPFFVVLPVGDNQFNPPAAKALPERIRVVAPVRDHPLRFLPRRADGLWDTDFRQRGFRKRNFSRRGTFQPNSQRKTLTVDQYHPLCAFAPLGFADRRAPFLAGAKLPSRKASSHLSRLSWSNAPSSVRQACSHTPSSSHCFSRRQQVEGEGKSSGRKRHAAPVWRIHKMPSKQARFGAGGRPRLSGRRLGLGSRGSISTHCSSLNSFCRSFMAEVQQFTCPTHKYLR